MGVETSDLLQGTLDMLILKIVALSFMFVGHESPRTKNN
jgi:hypothetical protein